MAAVRLNLLSFTPQLSFKVTTSDAMRFSPHSTTTISRASGKARRTGFTSHGLLLGEAFDGVLIARTLLLIGP